MSCALCRRPPGMHLLPQDASKALVAEVERCVESRDGFAHAEELRRRETAPVKGARGAQVGMFGGGR